MIVVSNASPLINLARIGQIGLLRELYGELWIPEAVWREVVEEGRGQAGAEEVGQGGWIVTQLVTNQLLVEALQQELDAGEAEARSFPPAGLGSLGITPLYLAGHFK